METIQIVLDTKLRQAIDRAAKCRKMNRSALLREAAREHLKRLHIRDLEERDRKGYEAVPETEDDWHLWEREAVWPEK